MNDDQNVLDLPPRGPARHRAILAAREQYIDDTLRRCRPGDGVLIDGDEMQAGVAKIIGDEVNADDLEAAVQWWNTELQKQPRTVQHAVRRAGAAD